jgi:hypothetical protein
VPVNEWCDFAVDLRTNGLPVQWRLSTYALDRPNPCGLKVQLLPRFFKNIITELRNGLEWRGQSDRKQENEE